MIDAYLIPIALNIGGSIVSILPMATALACLFTTLHWVAEPCNKVGPWWKKPGLLTDFAFMFMIPIMGGWVRVFFLLFGATFIYGLTEPDDVARFFKGGFGPLSGIGFWPQTILYLVIADVMMYWTHRGFHTMSLWRYHAVHHAPEHLDWTSATRFHPVNIFFHSVLADAVLILLGVAPEVLVFLGPFNVAMSAFVHANLDWTLGPFRYVIAGPVFHRWHHTDYRRGGNMNFAPTFPVLDLVFGTFYMPKGELPDRFGIHDKAFPEGLGGQLMYPFRGRKKRQSADGKALPAAP